MIKVGLIGAGLIGTKRAANLVNAKLVVVQDKKRDLADKLAAQHKALVEEKWNKLIQREDIDAVIVATSHDALSNCAVAALKAGKHVLVEKPGGRTPDEIRRQIEAAKDSKKILRVGFNHRFHPSFQKISSILKSNELGPLMFIRARYGHGGRLGYEKEWRADPKISGGGELLDQGVHLIDLSRWLGGEFNLAWSKTNTFYWPMKVEDHGFLALESPDHKRWAWLQASWVEWKNIFSFEVFCQRGKLEVSGLGGSYGVEELKCFRMKPEMGPPPVDILTFPGEDNSWKMEWASFVKAINGSNNDDGASGEDAQKVLEIVQGAYAENRTLAKI